jgi:hypothetical protein
MKTEYIILLLFLGWLIGWTLKYIVFGLGAWDNIFHPERFQADTTGPYKMFAKPFLGVLSAA